MNPIIGIIGAMDAEIAEYLSHAREDDQVKWSEFVFHRAAIEDAGRSREVVVVKSGIGKVYAAMVCQKLIDLFNPVAILFTGVAGALNPTYAIGDVVVSHDCLQHDVDGRAFGFERGQLLLSPHKIFTADATLKSSALKAEIPGHTIREGRILTGDQFLTRADLETHRYLIDEMHGDAVEMEGAAVAQVCTLNALPWVLIRTISDKADGSAAVDFEAMLPTVASNSYAVVRKILATQL